MTSTTNQRLQIYKRHTANLEKQIRALLGEPPKILTNYRAHLGKELRTSRAVSLSTRDLKKKMAQADIILVGDFHTYRQSQRTFYRLLRWLNPKDWTVGLELVGSHQNSELKKFLKSRIGEAEFLHAIHYQSLWGFHWENYAPIFRQMQKAGFEGSGINRPEAFISFNDNDLKNRDLWSAGCITDLCQKKRKVIALIGDWHLSSKHLPQEIEKIFYQALRRKPNLLVIHQNPDVLFWRLAKKHPIHHNSIFDLGKDRIAVFSGTPWEKQQSLQAWVDEVELANPLDSVESMKEDLDLICGVLKLNPFDLGSFTSSKHPHRHASHLAESAGLLLINHHRAGFKHHAKRAAASERVTRKALSFFMSLLAHPKRKTDLPMDWKIDQTTSGLRALKILESILRKGSLPNTLTSKDYPAIDRVSALIGYFLHQRFSQNKISAEWITQKLQVSDPLAQLQKKVRADLVRSMKKTKFDLL